MNSQETDEILRTAEEELIAGHYVNAEKLYRKILEFTPDNPQANHNLAIVKVRMGTAEDAFSFFQRALENDPKNARYWLDFIGYLIKQNKIDAASKLLEKALNFGAQGGGFDALGEQITKMRHMRGGSSNFTQKKENILLSMGLTAALRQAEKKVKQGLTDDARRIYKDILQRYPHNRQALAGIKPKPLIPKTQTANAEPPVEVMNKITKLYSIGEYQQALKVGKKFQARFPDSASLLNIIGAIYRKLHRPSEAIDAFKAVVKKQVNSAEACFNLGLALKDSGQVEEAIIAYMKSIKLNPNLAEAHRNLSYALLSTGRLEEGFNEWEWRWKTREGASMLRKFRQPFWDKSQALQRKTILIWSEQGIGDTINWSSCLNLISSKADKCIVECQSKLVPLLQRSFPNISIQSVDKSNDDKRQDFDVHIPMGSLYRELLNDNLNLHGAKPFIIPCPERVKYWRSRLERTSNGPYIGIAWKSANMSAARIQNYASIEDWLPIFSLSNATFINLQYTDFQKDMDRVKTKFSVDIQNFNDLDQFNDIDEVAALCAALDVVVATAGVVPLLSAAVGTQTKFPAWEQSPWNNILFNPVGPDVKISTKNTGESWKNVFTMIAQEIAQQYKHKK